MRAPLALIASATLFHRPSDNPRVRSPGKRPSGAGIVARNDPAVSSRSAAGSEENGDEEQNW
jgi:hypothetical protein